MTAIYVRIKINVDGNECSPVCSFYQYGVFCKLFMTGLFGVKRCKECVKASINYTKDIS